MSNRAAVTCITSVALLSFLPSAHAQRSFVGKKLPPVQFLDTEGHTIVPAHYEGSVLVLITGIPW